MLSVVKYIRISSIIELNKAIINYCGDFFFTLFCCVTNLLVLLAINCLFVTYNIEIYFQYAVCGFRGKKPDLLFHHNNSLFALEGVAVPPALLWVSSGSAVLCWAGLGTKVQGYRWYYVWSSWRSRAVPQQGAWQPNNLARRPRSLDGTQTATATGWATQMSARPTLCISSNPHSQLFHHCCCCCTQPPSQTELTAHRRRGKSP